MAVDVIMPQMGESIFEGTITKWLKKPGDKIERDEPLFEISTDKVDAEIPAPAAGVLKEIKVNEGQTVPIQTVVATIDAAGAGAATSTPAPANAASCATRAGSRPRPKPRNRRLPRRHRNRKPRRHGTAYRRRVSPRMATKVRSSPLVRRIAREQNIDLSQVPGTGAGGRVSKSDILASVEGATAAPSAVPGTAPAQRPAAPPPTGGALAGGAFRNGGPARKDVFRPIRSPADVQHAAKDRGAHGALEAGFAARLFDR